MQTDVQTKFEPGKSYSVRSLCDHDCIFSFRVMARTAKTIDIAVHGRVVRRRIRQVDGAECIDPFGRYSMSPVLSADEGAQ